MNFWFFNFNSRTIATPFEGEENFSQFSLIKRISTLDVWKIKPIQRAQIWEHIHIYTRIGSSATHWGDAHYSESIDSGEYPLADDFLQLTLSGIDLFTTRFWKSILESCHENEVPHFKPDLVSARYDTLGGLRSIMKIDTRDFSRPGQDSSDLHFVNAGIYIKNLFYHFCRKQRIVKIASIDKIAASDTFWHIMWLGGVK